MVTQSPALLAISSQEPGNQCRALLESFAETGGEVLQVSFKRTKNGNRNQPSNFKRVELVSDNPEKEIEKISSSLAGRVSVVCEDEIASRLCARIGLNVDLDLHHLPETNQILSSPQNPADVHATRKIAANLQGKSLWLRDWEVDDIRQIWHWNNEPVARAAAIQPRSITWASHCLWFEQAQASDQAKGFFATSLSGESVGYACCQLRQEHAEMEVVLSAQHRGQGLGAELIEAASRRLLVSTEVASIHAYLKHGNVVSLRAFEQAGFIRQGSTTRKGSMVYHFQLMRSKVPSTAMPTNVLPQVSPSQQPQPGF
jgi:RimJ/RimL family protein N-acetyltransferase